MAIDWDASVLSGTALPADFHLLHIQKAYIHDESPEVVCGVCAKVARFQLVGPRENLELCDEHVLGVAVEGLNRWAKAEKRSLELEADLGKFKECPDDHHCLHPSYQGSGISTRDLRARKIYHNDGEFEHSEEEQAE